MYIYIYVNNQDALSLLIDRTIVYKPVSNILNYFLSLRFSVNEIYYNFWAIKRYRKFKHIPLEALDVILLQAIFHVIKKMTCQAFGYSGLSCFLHPWQHIWASAHVLVAQLSIQFPTNTQGQTAKAMSSVRPLNSF